MAKVDTIRGDQGQAPSTDSSRVEPQTINDDRNLPGTDKGAAPSTVNWLGSSYSGADIKVVAHTYGTVEQLEDIKIIEEQIAAYKECAGALRTLAAFWASDYEVVVASNRQDEADFRQRLLHDYEFEFTRSTMRQWDAHFRQYNYRIRTGPVTAAALALADQLEKSADELQETIKPIKELIENSSSTQVLGTLQTLSVQTHREKYPVRALGHGYAKGYTRGPRTIAGSMILTVFNEHALKDFIRASSVLMKKYGELDYYTSSLLPDQLPPLDLTIAFVNEYGSRSRMSIYGVEFVNDGVTYSIEDLLSEQVINFVARDIDIMTDHGKVKLTRYESGMFGLNGGEIQTVRGTDLAFSDTESYNRYLTAIGLRRRFKNV